MMISLAAARTSCCSDTLSRYLSAADPSTATAAFFAFARAIRSCEHRVVNLLRDRRRQHLVLKFLRRREQRKLALRRASKNLTRDDQPVDFVRAFIDAADTSVPVSSLNRIIFRVAVAAEHLNRFIRNVIERLAADDLDY